MALFKAGYSIKYMPVKARPRIGASKINVAKDGARFIVIIMKIATLFSPLRIFLPISILFASIGIGHALIKIFFLGGRYTEFSFFFITAAIMIFLMGLIAEQIALLRLERSEHS